MKRIVMKFIILFAASVTLFNCEKGTEPTQPVQESNFVVEPASLELAGGPDFDILTLFRTDGARGPWNVVSSPEWLSVEPPQGFFWMDTLFARLRTHFDRLEYGSYSGTIVMQSGSDRAEVEVSLNYTPPELDLQTLVINLDRYYSQGDFIIGNAGSGGLIWSITEHPEWLQFETLSDTVYGPYQHVHFQVNYRGMEYGDYEGVVKLETNAGSAQVNAYFSYYRPEEVIPGVGAARIELGYSYDRVRKILGEPDRNWYDRPEHTVFIHYFSYDDMGLLFSVQNNSPILYGTGKVGYIHLSYPYDGLTVEKRIGIGSSLADVKAAYGDPTSIGEEGYYYDIGITFDIKSDTVSAMIIK